MKSVNTVILLGNVTRDPEIKALPSGQSLCAFGLATNRVWKDKAGERQSVAEYHNLVCFGPLAEFAGTHVQKGKPLYVRGRLKTRSWEDADGKKHSRTEIVAEDVVLLGARDAGPAEAEAPVDASEPDPEGSTEA